MEDGQYVEGSLWIYAPNKGAPIAFMILFLCSGLFHFYQCYKYKTWRSTGFLPWSALLFVAGFACRTVGAYHYDNLAIYIASTVLLYAAPPIYELSNYVTLSRLLHYIPHHSPIHPGRIIVTFLGLSVVVEALTANGAAQSANSDNSPSAITTGKALLKAALVLQLVVLLIFVGTALRFQLQCTKSGMLSPNQPARLPVLRVLTTLYISTTLITTRTIYRTVEYFTAASLHPSDPGFSINTTSPILRYEWFFWFFEATLMFLNTCLLNARHPGRYLPSDKYVYLTPEGEERHGNVEDMEDKRGLWMKMVDPFDIGGLVMGRDKERRYWERGEERGGVEGLENGVKVPE